MDARHSLGDLDVYLFKQGRHTRLYEHFGAHPESLGSDSSGARFVVWAPNAAYVSVVGDFNAWDRAAAPMTMRCSIALRRRRMAGAQSEGASAAVCVMRPSEQANSPIGPMMQRLALMLRQRPEPTASERLVKPSARRRAARSRLMAPIRPGPS